MFTLQHFTQEPKTFHRAVALQASFFNNLGEVTAVLLDLVSVFSDSMMLSSDNTG